MSRGVVKDVAVDHGLGMIDDQRMLVILTLFNTILWHYTADIFLNVTDTNSKKKS